MAWTPVQHFVQTAQLTFTPVASTQVTLGSAVAVGDTILLMTTVGTAAGVDDAAYVASVTDQLGNTYTRRQRIWDSTDNQATAYWSCLVTVAGTPTITYDPDTTDRPWIAILGDHFTGSDAASTIRDSQVANPAPPGTGADAIATASVAAQNGDLQWVGCMDLSLNTAATIGTGFTSLGASSSGLRTEYKVAGGAGIGSFTDATNGAVDHYEVGSIAVTPAAGGAPQRTLLGVGQ